MRVKLQFFATILCLLGILAGVACKLWFPQYWFGLYPMILVVYWIIEMIMSFIIGHYEGYMNQASLQGSKWMKTYMLSKFCKVFITLALILIGLNYIGESTHRIIFAASAVVFYLLNLAIETYVVTRKK
ncbi:MAG: hypothetical protein K6E54_11110 [Bacteroidaceae bacterium]|nr:hypothetical protein [Bacteroidaceae bacterium]